MELLKSFRVKNFLTIKDIELDFNGAGVYHIRGENDIGKTSLIRAFDAHFTNLADNQYKELIRDDCDYFETESIDVNGNRVKLSRGSVDYYEWDIDGNVGRLDNTRGKVPPIVEKYFDLYIDVKSKENLNIRYKDDKSIFTKTSSQANYRYLEKALGTEIYSKAFNNTKSLLKDKTNDNKYLNIYLEKEEETLRELETKRTKVNETLNSLKDISKTVKETMKIYNLLDKLNTASNDLGEKLNEKKELSGGLFNFDLQKLDDETISYTLLQRLDEKLKEFNSLAKKKKEYLPLSKLDIKVLENEFKTVQLLESINERAEELNSLETKSEGIVNIELTEVESAMNKLDTLIKLDNLSTEMMEKEKAKEEAEKELNNIEKEIEEFLNTFDVCPFCGQEIGGSCCGK